MKRIGTVAAIACTLALVFLGAAMPNLATRALDHRLEKKTIERTTTAPSLTYGSEPDYLQALELFASAHSQITLSEGVYMTEDEARAAAESLLDHLQVDRLPPPDLVATPLLATSNDAGGVSGVYWVCTWEYADGVSGLIWLDDATGMAVAFELYSNNSTLAYLDDGLPEHVELVLSYLRRSETVDVAEAVSRIDDPLLCEYTISLKRTEGGEKISCEAPLCAGDSWLSFNLGRHSDATAMPS